VTVESLEDAASWLVSSLEGSPPSIKGPEWMYEAMKYYMETQFPSDKPMVAIAEASNELNERFQSAGTVGEYHREHMRKKIST